MKLAKINFRGHKIDVIYYDNMYYFMCENYGVISVVKIENPCGTPVEIYYYGNERFTDDNKIDDGDILNRVKRYINKTEKFINSEVIKKYKEIDLNFCEIDLKLKYFPCAN